MKMIDLNESFGEENEFGLGDDDKELDNPERGMNKGFKNDPIVVQVGKIVDTRSGDNPITSVTTDDGKDHKVGPNMAGALKGLLKGEIGDMKPMARERLQNKLQTSQGLEHLLSAKTGRELLAKAEELIGMKDVDRAKDKSIY